MLSSQVQSYQRSDRSLCHHHSYSITDTPSRVIWLIQLMFPTYQMAVLHTKALLTQRTIDLQALLLVARTVS
jgi:hypothetical protein